MTSWFRWLFYRDIDRKLDLILDDLAVLLLRTGRPGKLRVRVYGENAMSMLFEVDLPPVVSSDVVARKLTVVINGESSVVDLAADATVATGLKGPQDANVELSLVDVDDAGNESQPSPTLTVVLVDTIAPAAPGELGVRIVGEENDPVDPVDPSV